MCCTACAERLAQSAQEHCSVTNHLLSCRIYNTSNIRGMSVYDRLTAGACAGGLCWTKALQHQLASTKAVSHG